MITCWSPLHTRSFLKYSVLSPFSAITLASLVLLVVLAELIEGFIFFTLVFSFLSGLKKETVKNTTHAPELGICL